MIAFRRFLPLLLIGLLCGCLQESETVRPQQNFQPMAARRTIPVDEALGQLDGLLARIDGPTTRASRRSVERVRVLRRCDLVATRSENGYPADLDSILYFVDFADDRGSAILGADNRLPAVVTVTESPIDWKRKLVDFDITQIGTGPVDTVGRTIISLVKNYIDYQVSSRGFRSWYREWEEYVPPMMRTKWNQQSPYNELCYTDDGRNAYAGCVAIALGQIFYFNHFPEVIDNYRFDWDLLGQWTVDATTYTDEGIMEVAYFIHYIGLGVDMTYGAIEDRQGSSSSIDNAAFFMKELGYRDVEIGQYSDADVKEMIFKRNKPIYCRANMTDGLFVGSGHAWVIDGGIRRYFTVCSDSGSGSRIFEGQMADEELLVHCDFGWGGEYNGFYYSGIFDLSKPAAEVDDDLREHPIDNPNGYIYDYNLMLITYS
ncbi:C10 family peptidase [uncultured Alistipes sp.]|jgi:hypothetical protein|uniref:C10 family peptidase n=1 Tax=Alistipes sp. TaxID=1872444 RepID=UPI00266B799A|nr:C10 family peptidase [uncultured Alistipes sp.]